MVHRGQVL